MSPLTRDAAEALAAEALAWIAMQEELLHGFLATSGSDPREIGGRIGDPEFLGAVLDYLLTDEPALMAFCENRAVCPELPLRARAALPGGDLPNWT